MSEPLRFVFGVHVHQPVGNPDHIFAEHVRDVYLPFLRRMAERDVLPVVLHVSGPLLEWLEAHDTAYLDLIGRLAADGRVELLLSGMYEPVLAALPRADRLEQIAWMRQAITRRFGVEPSGLWLTERVWQPSLAADLAEAGVTYALVDDRHFLVAGFERRELHAPFFTESDGHALALFSIDERLRYLVPFREPAELAAYLRQLRGAGHRLAVLVDDGEKFGGWPGTADWVYARGWLSRFLDTLTALRESGEVQLSTLAEALVHVPSGGIAYLPTASYREMEAWALPPAAAARLAVLERDLGADRLAGPDGSLVRGTHWHGFFAKYPEANRMHKKMVALSKLCRRRNDPAGARRAIGRAQCNDAYWHGVFGGLYLPHLRQAVWANLAEAESVLRAGEPIEVEVVDLDYDGHDEVWVHSAAFSAILSPRRGAVVEEYTRFAERANVADVLTRRREVYHELAPDVDTSGESDPESKPSIRDLERTQRRAVLPPVDDAARALFVDRVLPADLTLGDFARGGFTPVRSWARTVFRVAIERTERAVLCVCQPAGEAFGLLEKRLRFGADGAIGVTYRWDSAAFPHGALFAAELSLARDVPFEVDPPADIWWFEVATTSKSERAMETVVQGSSHTVRWPVAAGRGEIRLAPPRVPVAAERAVGLIPALEGPRG